MARLYAHPERQAPAPPPDPTMIARHQALVRRVEERTTSPLGAGFSWERRCLACSEAAKMAALPGTALTVVILVQSKQAVHFRA